MLVSVGKREKREEPVRFSQISLLEHVENACNVSLQVTLCQRDQFRQAVGTRGCDQRVKCIRITIPILRELTTGNIGKQRFLDV